MLYFTPSNVRQTAAAIIGFLETARKEHCPDADVTHAEQAWQQYLVALDVAFARAEEGYVVPDVESQFQAGVQPYLDVLEDHAPPPTFYEQTHGLRLWEEHRWTVRGALEKAVAKAHAPSRRRRLDGWSDEEFPEYDSDDREVL